VGTNEPGTRIYDFTDADWTTPRLESEFKLVVRFINEDGLKIGDRTPTADELRINRNYGARWKEIRAELDRRGHGKANARPSPARKGGRPRRGDKKEPRIPWSYAPVPKAILSDPDLSGNAKLVAARLALGLNLGRWNQDLHIDLSYADFEPVLSRDKARRAAPKLESAGHIRTESRNRGGVRYWFTGKSNRTDNEPT